MRWFFVVSIILFVVLSFFISSSVFFKMGFFEMGFFEMGFFEIGFFEIKSVSVHTEKVDCTDSNQIQNSIQLLGQNIFFINSSKIENDLKKEFICIKNVETSRNFPDKVKLSVFGREPVAILILLKSEEATISGELEKFSEVESTPGAEAFISAENFVVDNEGIIYSDNIGQINAPKIYISRVNLTLGQKIKEDLIDNSLKILEKIKVYGVNVNEAKIYSEDLLLINAMPRIIFKLDQNIDSQLASLQLILNQAKIDGKDLEFIDLRFDKPIVKLAPKKN